MLRDRDARQDPFALVPPAGLARDPVLAPLDALLDADARDQRVRAARAQRRPPTATRGRHSTPVAALLRLLVVKRLYGWRDEATAPFVTDSLVPRQGCRG